MRPVCRDCGTTLEGRTESVGVGSTETSWLGPDGSEWCPESGKFRSIEDWKADPHKRGDPEFSPCQYHAPVWEERAA